MSQLIEIPFVGGDYSERSREFNDQRTLNMYVRAAKPGSKTDSVLYSCPGLALFSQVSAVGGRSNGERFKGDIYFVFGSGLYQVKPDSTSTNVGTLTTTGGRCTLVAGRDYLLVLDGSLGYTWNGTTFAQISAPGFPTGATHCTYLDGYFIVNKGDSDEFYISANEDPTSWNALDFATASASPDNTLALTANFKNLYIVGEATTQIYYDSGNADFPFSAYPGGVLQFGIKAPYSLVKTSVGLFWLATSAEGDVQVVHVGGLSAQVVSDPISYALTQFTTTDDATALVYRYDGRTVYQITFPTEARTFEYRVEDRQWCERESFGIGRYRAAGAGILGSDYLFADYANGKLYQLDAEVYAEDGALMERLRQSKNYARSDNRITWHEFIVDITSGVGLNTGQGSDPQIMMAYSDDGGFTWSSELWRSMGAIGQYRKRVAWRRLGQSRQRVFRVKVTDPVNVTIIGAYARISEAATS